MSPHRPDPDPFPVSLELIHQALSTAFPTLEGLRRLVRFGLDESLEGVAGTGALDDVIYQLVVWAKAQGRLLDLLHGAWDTNPGNPKLRGLRAWVEDLPPSSSNTPFL